MPDKDQSLMLSLLMFVATALYGGDSINLIVGSDAGSDIGICSLQATLLLPDEPTAVVVMIHGSGRLDRNGTFPGGYQTYYDLASQLYGHNIASVRYDKRTFDPRCKDAALNSFNLSPMTFLGDAKAIVAAVSKSSKLRNIPIFLSGQSQGVNLAVRLAHEASHLVSGVVLLAGVFKYPIDQTVLRQLRELAGNLTIERDQRIAYRNLFNQGKDYFARLSSGRVDEHETFLTYPMTFWRDWIALTDHADRELRDLGMPRFLLQGELDWNISPEDFALGREILARDDRSESVLLPDLNHAFTPPETTRVPNAVGSIISRWIRGL